MKVVIHHTCGRIAPTIFEDRKAVHLQMIQLPGSIITLMQMSKSTSAFDNAPSSAYRMQEAPCSRQDVILY